MDYGGSGFDGLPPGHDNVIRISEVGMKFPNGTEALTNVNLEIENGTFVSIVGPSGCGKSSLLRIIAGLLRPTGGLVSLDDRSPAEMRRAARVSFVFQSPTLLPWRTLRSNVALPLDLIASRSSLAGRGATGEDKIDDLLSLTKLSGFADSYPRELSGGMKMRASLARALITSPTLMLMDEPFAALDEITRQNLNTELLSLWMRDRWTGLFVTHNVYEAVYLSSRVLVFGDRPGSVVGEFSVPFEYPRTDRIRATPEFAAVSESISRLLREAMPL